MLNNLLINQNQLIEPTTQPIPDEVAQQHQQELLEMATKSVINKLVSTITEEAADLLANQAAVSLDDPPANDDPFAADIARNQILNLLASALPDFACIHQMEQDKYIHFALAKASAR